MGMWLTIAYLWVCSDRYRTVRYSWVMARKSDEGGTVADALKALMAASAELSKAVTSNVTGELKGQVVPQVTAALRNAADSVESASRSVGTKRKSSTREAILAAASELFAERGIDASSLDEIAKRAGFTKGAIYSHFSSKNELIVALSENLSERDIVDGGSLNVLGGLGRSRPEGQISRDGEALRDVLLSMEMLLYALRHPEVRPQMADDLVRNKLRIEEAVRTESRPRAGEESEEAAQRGSDAALAIASIINMGGLYYLLDERLATPEALERVLRRAVG